jgi:hypothetical protein
VRVVSVAAAVEQHVDVPQRLEPGYVEPLPRSVVADEYDGIRVTLSDYLN